MNSKTIVNERTGFEVYLEGVKAPPASIRISENEGGFPNASVSFPATSAMLRVLPGTKVQIFGKDPLTEQQIVLFEGEITSVGYQKSGSSRSVSFNCESLLSRWARVTARPLDSMVTPQWREANGDKIYDYYNFTEEERAEAHQNTNNTMRVTASGVHGKVKQEVTGALEDALSDITLTEFAGYSDEIVQILNSDEVSAGDLYVLVQYFLRKFELFDPFYGMESIAYGLSDSVSTWPNFGKIDPFKNKATMDGVIKMSSELGQAFSRSGSLVLIEALRAVLSTMHFNLLAPSSFTSSYKFWGTSENDGKSPIRAYFTPNLENSPPAKFNLFFPHQVMSFSYSRPFDSEPTRTIGEVQLSYLNTDIDVKGAAAFIVEPGLNITQKGVEKNAIGFTPEETYRGVNVNIASFDSFYAEAREDETESKKGMGETDTQDYFDKVKPGLTQLTKNSHLIGRMGGRSVSFQTTWSPYRMTGVPAAYIEDGDGPSITGVISSISTSITANGNATSTITFRSPRFVYKKNDLDDDGEMINDFSLDPYSDINTFLFDEKVYDFKNIGGSLFSYFKYGKFSRRNEAFLEYANNTIEVEVGREKKHHQPFEEEKDRIEGMFHKKTSVNEDCSIIDFIRDETGEVRNALAADHELSPMEGYTRDIYEAVYKITDLYKNIEGQGALIDKWTNNLTYRNLTTKRDYFNSLDIEDPHSLHNSKDGIKLFTGTESLEAIKETVTADNNSRGRRLTNRESLEKERNSLERGRNQIRESIIRMEGLDNLGDIRSKYVILSEARMLRAKPYNISGIRPIHEDNVEEVTAAYVEEVTRLARRKANEIQEERKKINKQLNELSNSSGEEVAEEMVLLESIPEGFEYELFKPYNLTRRKHVDAALNRYVRNSLKSEREDDSSSDIRQNLNILE